MIRFLKKRLFTNHGDPIHILYKPVVAEDGTFTLEESGKENTDEIIQSYRESTDIQVIINKVSQGDISVLNKAKGMYIDNTIMPKTYAEFLQMQIDSLNMFNDLSPDIRKKFNNNPNEFFAMSGTEEWLKRLGVEIPKPDVKESNEKGTDE